MKRFCVGIAITVFSLCACGSAPQPAPLPTESNAPATTLPSPSPTPTVRPSLQLTSTPEPPATTASATIAPSAAPPTATETPPAAIEQLWVTEKQGLNLREKANTDSRVIKVLMEGQHVVVVGPKTGPDANGYMWLNIRTDDKEDGWAVAETPDGPNLSPTNPKAALTPSATAAAPAAADLWVIEKQGLNLRELDNVDAKIIKVLLDGQHVIVAGARTGPDAKGYIWLNIRTEDGQKGWVVAETRDGSNLSPTDPNPKATPAPPVTTITPTAVSTPTVTPTPGPGSPSPRELWVNAPLGLNLRDEAKASAKLIAVLKFGQRLTASTGPTGPDAGGITWQQVETNDGQKGWVAAEFLSPTSPLTPTPTRTP